MQLIQKNCPENYHCRNSKENWSENIRGGLENKWIWAEWQRLGQIWTGFKCSERTKISHKVFLTATWLPHIELIDLIWGQRRLSF